LSLRSLAGTAEAVSSPVEARVTWDSDVSRALGGGPRENVTVLRGGQKPSVSTTGGETAQ